MMDDSPRRSSSQFHLGRRELVSCPGIVELDVEGLRGRRVDCWVMHLG